MKTLYLDEYRNEVLLNMAHYMSQKETVICSKETVLETAWQISDSDDVDQIIIRKEQKETDGSRGQKVHQWTEHKPLTALLIACSNNDVELVTKLIEKGTDVNLIARSPVTDDDDCTRSNVRKSVPPIYCAAIKNNVEIVKLLIDAEMIFKSYIHLKTVFQIASRRDNLSCWIYVDFGKLFYDKECVEHLENWCTERVEDFERVEINSFQGLEQGINLQKPPDTRAIIGPKTEYPFNARKLFTRSRQILKTGNAMTSRVLKVLELYLKAGVKLNTTSWGPCLFFGRGKVYKANRPTTMHISGPWFICTSAIMLLQHGVDPNLYKFGDIVSQHREHREHCFFDRDVFCFDEQTFMATFLVAGYDLTVSDWASDLRSDTDYEIMNTYGRTPCLKQLVRTNIRKHIRSINEDTSVFPIIDKLQLPRILKDFLKLYDVSPSNPTSINCFEHMLN